MKVVYRTTFCSRHFPCNWCAANTISTVLCQSCTETTLALKDQVALKVCIEAIERDAGKDLANDGEHGYAMVVITDVSVSFTLSEVDDKGVLECLW